MSKRTREESREMFRLGMGEWMESNSESLCDSQVSRVPLATVDGGGSSRKKLRLSLKEIELTKKTRGAFPS